MVSPSRFGPYRAVVFDLDNTIVLKEDKTGSSELKRVVWQETFPPLTWDRLSSVFPEIWRQSRSERNHRDSVARKCLRFLRGSDPSEADVSELLDAYNHRLEVAIAEIGVDPRDRAFLNSLGQRVRWYINSATPQKELERIVAILNIDTYCTCMYGGEVGKVSALQLVASEMAVTDRSQLLMVGDSPVDHDAAQAFGCPFAGIATLANGWTAGRSDMFVFDRIYKLGEFFA